MIGQRLEHSRLSILGVGALAGLGSTEGDCEEAAWWDEEIGSVSRIEQMSKYTDGNWSQVSYCWRRYSYGKGES